MDYLLFRQGHYYYNRRVPSCFREFDSRDFIRISLKTTCRKQAVKLAIKQNDEIESYWVALAQTGQKHSHTRFQDIVQRSRLLGVNYLQSQQLALAPLEQLIERLLHVQKNNYNPLHVEAVLGGVAPPSINIDDALKRYWDFSKNKVLNKSPNQIRKWQLPRTRAINNFIKCVGNKPLTEISRDDTLRFRDWWIKRVDEEKLSANSANKDIIHLKVVLESVSDNLKLSLDVPHLFKKLLLLEENEKKRLPFETSYIINTLLNPENLSGLNPQAKWILHAMAETGAGLSELVGLLPEDIVLDAEIPHICILPRPKKPLKTKYRKRVIPLVGFALDAFKACPQGFTDYWDRPDALSSVLGKYLSENNLLPTPNHTVYSLRHSFQDRILSVNTPDRIQADLMGHKFNRQAYGEGGTLAHKLEWMEKVQLKKIILR